MFNYDPKTMNAVTGPAREAFEAWISFFPTAPLFGVPWRFAPDLDLFGSIAPKPTQTKTATTPTVNPVSEAPIAREVKAVKPTNKPKAAKAKASAPQPKNDGGPVVQLKGIGPKLADELAEMGIVTVADIAALTKDDLARVDAKLTSIKGRCYRDDWVGQAKALLADA